MESPKTTAENRSWEYDGPTTLELVLSRPIKLHDADPNTLTSITLSEPTIAQMAAHEDSLNSTKNEMRAAAVFIQRNANPKISIAQAEALSSRDCKKAVEFLMGFTTPPLKVGES